jgi:alkylation response protein AidB-like acyl-CoA dehydrogenase
LSAGSYAPAGQGVMVDGGYRVSGQWGFCSGCDNSQWLHLGAMIPDGTGAKPGFIMVPTVDCVIDDNWHTMGLSGTGSKNIVAKDVFVPKHRTVAFADLAAGQAPGVSVHGNPSFRQSFLAVLPATIVVPVLGMAEGALASFLDMVKVRVTRGAVTGGNRRMAEFATVQQRAAEATACIDAAKLLIFRDLAEAYDAVLRGDAANVDLRLRNRRDQAFCVKLLVQAVDALFLAAGGQGLFLDHPLQRAWRDAHAAASHISLNWDSAGTMYGQHLLGLEPKGQY